MYSHEVFNKRDANRIFNNKFIVVVGDSNQRGLYKDLVLLLQEDRYLCQQELRQKGEYSFLGDELIEGGRKGEMVNGIAYKEVRQYQTDNHLVRFYFMTRCYNSYLETILNDLKEGPNPDLLIMNSCLWDITRYGKESINDYKVNLQKVFTRFQESLPPQCLVIWTTTLPISSRARGGFIVPEIEFMSTTLRLDILEANFFATTVASSHGYDVLDLHFYLRHYLQCRVKDGIHWDMMAHRYITNLILSHVCDAWDLSLPSQQPATFGSYGSVAGAQRRQERMQGSYVSDNWYSDRRDGRYVDNSRARNGLLTRQWSGQLSSGVPQWNWQGVDFSRAWNGRGVDFSTAWVPSNSSGSRDCGSSYARGRQEAEQFEWQSYQQSSYRGAAPNRRQERQHNNPYSRRRRY